MTALHEDETSRARRFGWASLLVWVTAGLGIEGAQGFRVAGYVGDELTRTLLRLAHAHGVGLSLVVLVYSSAGVPLIASRSDGGLRIGRRLRAAAVLIPSGFALSAVGHPEGDPSLAILAVPLGALLLLASLAHLVFASLRRPS